MNNTRKSKFSENFESFNLPILFKVFLDNFSMNLDLIENKKSSKRKNNFSKIGYK